MVYIDSVFNQGLLVQSVTYLHKELDLDAMPKLLPVYFIFSVSAIYLRKAKYHNVFLTIFAVPKQHTGTTVKIIGRTENYVPQRCMCRHWTLLNALYKYLQ